MMQQGHEAAKYAVQVYLAKPDLSGTGATATASATEDGSEEYDESDTGSESDDSDDIDSDDDDDDADSNVHSAINSTETAVAATAEQSAKMLVKEPSVEPVLAGDGSLTERSSTASSTDNGHADLMQAVNSGISRNVSNEDGLPSSSSSSSITPGAEFLSDEASLSEGASTDTSPEEATALDVTAVEEDDGIDVDKSSALIDWVDDCDSTVCTLVIQKGQHQQELLVSGGITRQQLTHEVDSIVASLNAAQAGGLANNS